jgi:hypothetical protein
VRHAAWIAITLALPLSASDHGPVFGLGTPTNPKGGWSFNLGFNRRGGSGMMQTQLSYGVTENLKVTFSAPLDVQADAHAPSSVTASVPFAGDFGLAAWYRFYRKDLKGKRVEATASGGPLFSGPQQEVGRYRGFPTGVGWTGGAVTGVASRSYYVWGGGTYQWYPQVGGNQRPNLVTFTGVAGYRPFSWRTDYPRWDWRIFGEVTAERSGVFRWQNAPIAESRARQVFAGPSVLGVYRSIGIEAGVQFPLYRNVTSFYQRETYRAAINLAYFF